MSNLRRGVIYVVFGAEWQREAARSMASVRRYSPGVPIAVITDEEWGVENQPDYIIRRARLEPVLRTKSAYMYEACPFDEAIFLDSDTVAAQDVRPLFGLLSFYDFCVQFVGQEVGEGELRIHPPARSGMLVFKKCRQCEGLFALWARLYAEACRSSGQENIGSDRFLGVAVARSSVRVGPLPQHALLDLGGPEIAFAAPLVCHGRLPRMEQIAEWLVRNWSEGKTAPLQRVWLPNIRGLLPSGLRRAGLLFGIFLCFARLCSELRYRLMRVGAARKGAQS